MRLEGQRKNSIGTTIPTSPSLVLLTKSQRMTARIREIALRVGFLVITFTVTMYS
jgi:hypothetical protein